MVGAENRGFTLPGEGHILPGGDVQPAPDAVLFHGGIQLQIAGFTVSDLRVDAQHRAQGLKALGQQGPEPVLVYAVGHNKLFYDHDLAPPFSFWIFSSVSRRMAWRRAVR